METLLAVPNISEGRDLDLVAAIAGTACLLDVHSDPDHNRSVLTYGGDPHEVVRACASMVERAVARLRLGPHEGVHPRFGVVDVLPLVPYGTSEAAAQNAVGELVWTIGAGPGVPVRFYGRASAERITLPALRKQLATDPGVTHPTAGVLCVGIRDPLIAFNVNLRCTLDEARALARDVRSDEIRALGLPLSSRELTQVSMNLVVPDVVGPRAAFERVALRTDAVVDCEVVGLVPGDVLPQLGELPMAQPARSIEDALTLRR